MRTFLVARAMSYLFCLCPVAARGDDLILFDDRWQNGWELWKWAKVEELRGEEPHRGDAGLGVTDESEKGMAALQLHHSPFDTAPFDGLRLWVHGGPTGAQDWTVCAVRGGEPGPPVALPPLAVGESRELEIALAELGAADCSDLEGLWVRNSEAHPAPTLYIDEISLSGRAPPDRVRLEVRGGKPGRRIDPRTLGINLAMWDSHLADPATVDLLAAMGLNVLRLPGGSRSDDYHWHTNRSPSDGVRWPNSTTVFARVVEAVRAAAVVTVNYGDGTPEEAAAWVAWANGDPDSTEPIGVDSRGEDWKTVGHWASLRAAAPLAEDDGWNHLRAGHPRPYGWRYWEVGNEIYGSWERDRHGTTGSALEGKPHDATTYAREFARFLGGMTAVDPKIRVGAVVVAGQDSWDEGNEAVPNPAEGGAMHRGWTPVLLTELARLGVTPHFVSHHVYPQHPGRESDVLLLQSSGSLAADAADLRRQLRDYLGPERAGGIELALTELNSVSSDVGKQTTSLVNALFMADSIASLAQTELGICTWWALRNGIEANGNNRPELHGWREYGDYGVEARRPGGAVETHPTFHAAGLLRHWAGGQALETESDFPLLAVHAARRDNGSLALLVINKSGELDLSAEIVLSDFEPGDAPVRVFTYGEENDRARTDASESEMPAVSGTLRRTFPRRSITLLELKP